MADYWKVTQQILQSSDDPLVDKPKLDEKYLLKPPYRFLFDIVSAVQRKTGFAPGLFDQEDLDPKAEKDIKVRYLTKIINVVGLSLNEHIPAKPPKIVAGLEPENTNRLLQALGRAARLGTAADAVQRVLKGEAQPAPGQQAPPPAPAAPQRPSSRPSSQQRGKEERPVDADGPPAEPPAARPQKAHSSSAGPPDTATERAGSGEARARRSSTDKDVSERAGGERTAEKQASRRSRAPPAAGGTPTAAGGRGTAEEATEAARAAPSLAPAPQQQATTAPPDEGRRAAPTRQSSRGPRSSNTDARDDPPAKATPPPPAVAATPPPPVEAEPPPGALVSNAQKFSRPQSARKAPPKLPQPADSVLAGARPPGTMRGLPGTAAAGRGAAGGAGAAATATPAVAIFEEGAQDNEEDDTHTMDVDNVASLLAANASILPTMDGAQGVLVKNILQAAESLKKAGEAAAGGNAAQQQQEEGGGGIILRRQAKGAGAPGAKAGDLTQIRELIQRLCQSSLPLARGMDYLQEDLDNMAKEYRFWVTERRVYADKLLEAQRSAEDVTALAAQVEDVEGQIRQARERVIAMKAKSLHNDATIQKLLTMVTTGSR